MQITEIYYEKVFPIAPYVNEKIGVKLLVGDEMPARVLNDAKEFVNAWGYKMMEDRPSGTTQFEQKEYYGVRAADHPYGNISVHTDDQEFEELKKQLDTFLTEETASLYLQTTPFKFSVEAKNYIKEKFKKDEQ